jgi:hypothetical protein
MILQPTHSLRWGDRPLNRRFMLPVREIDTALPRFEKLQEIPGALAPHPHLDFVAARPGHAAMSPDQPRRGRTVVGMVSRTYQLVQHADLISRAVRFTLDHLDHTVPEVEIAMTAQGERLLAKLDLGPAFHASPDGKNVRVKLCCRNSVDGSSAMQAWLSWERLICRNGMVVGVTLGRTRLAHTANSKPDKVFEPLAPRLTETLEERKVLDTWTTTKVRREALRNWVDGPVAEQWNTLCAARVWSICSTGQDARFVPPFERAAPSRRRLRLLGLVPGAVPQADNLYAVSQALSWVASHRHDAAEAEIMQRQISFLLARLRN